MGKVFEWIVKTCSGTQLQALQPQLAQLELHPSFIEFTIENKVWGFFSLITFQPLDGNCNIIIDLLHLSVYIHTWRFYKNCICSVSEQIIVKQEAGVVLTLKKATQQLWRQFVTQSEHRSLGFYQRQISKNPWLLTLISRRSDDALKCNYTARER